MSSNCPDELSKLLTSWKCGALYDRLLNHGFTIDNLDEVTVTHLLIIFGEKAFLGPLLKLQKSHTIWIQSKRNSEKPPKLASQQLPTRGSKQMPAAANLKKEVIKDQLSSVPGTPNINNVATSATIDDDTDSDDDREPLYKKIKRSSVEKVKDYIRNVVTAGDWEEMTIRSVRHQVLASFPYAASYEKRFFKDEIESVITSRQKGGF